MKTQILCRS